MDSSNGNGRGSIVRIEQVGRSDRFSGYYAVYLLKIRDEVPDG